MSSQNILLAVGSIDERSRASIIEIGGRVEIAASPRSAETGQEPLGAILVELPAEKAKISRSYITNRREITLRPSEHTEIYLTLDLDDANNVAVAELRFVERIEATE